MQPLSLPEQGKTSETFDAVLKSNTFRMQPCPWVTQALGLISNMQFFQLLKKNPKSQNDKTHYFFLLFSIRETQLRSSRSLSLVGIAD